LYRLVGNIRTVVDKHRVDGSRVRLAEVEVGDETGTVSLRARDDQIDVLNEIASRSGAVVLRNCALEIYQGKHIRLAITKWGKLSAYPDQVPSTPPPPSKINRDRNFSKINISLVASEMPSQQQQQAPETAFSDADSMSAQGSTNFANNRSYQQSNQNRRGRRPSRGKPSTGPGGQVHSYQDSIPSTMRSYQGGGGMHGYHGFVAESVSPQTQYYTPRRQQETSHPSVGQQQQSQQQIMFSHHGFDMQQQHQPRPTQMQMYHHSSTPPPPPPQHHHRQMRAPMQQTPPMHVSGIPANTSFDTSSYSTSSELPPTPLHGVSHHLHHPAFLVPISNEAAAGSSNRPDSPGKMNPQAATFDPSAPSNYHHYQSF
jgi:hypothetical protein